MLRMMTEGRARQGVRSVALDALATARDAGAAAVRSARDVTIDFGRDSRARDVAAAVSRNAYGMLVLDDSGTVVHANPAAAGLLSDTVDNLVGRPFGHRVSAGAPVEIDIGHPDGTTGVAEMQAVETVWDGRPALLVSLHDVSARVRAQQRLADEAMHDRLTAVAGRELFIDRIRHALDEARRPPHPGCAVLFIDLDRFKEVNDTFGHRAGDAALRAVAGRLTDCVRPGDTVGRLGGDEFGMLLQRCEDTADARQVGARILAALAEPVVVGGYDFDIGASIGVAFGREGETHPDELLADADRAMYHGKALGGGRVTVFDEAMHRQSVWRDRLENDFRSALERGELRVHYQPVIDLDSERIEGFEALVRWEHPARGLIPPSEFLPMAEQVGLIGDLGRFVLRDACAQLQSWRDEQLVGDRITITVNVSSRELANPGFLDDVTSILRESGVPAANLRLDITETTLMGVERSVDRLAQLAALGVQLQIDDFGAGYSSLRDLDRLPVAALKLDRDLVAGVEEGRGSALVQAAVAFAHALEIRVVAECVETDAQRVALRRLGCDAVQGFVVTAPLAADEAADLLPA